MGKLVVAAITSLWAILISIIINRIVPEPYMDEIFHVPQAQRYCNGDFRSWDPMITTPPGLYYLSLAHIASLFPGMFLTRNIQSFSEACSTSILRSTNAVLMVFCSVLVYEIIRFLRPNLNDRIATFVAVVMTLYPLHWFFTFLYYTDVASLTAVLAMYLTCLKKKYKLSALLGTLAVLIRQTNIIWMLFAVVSGIVDITLSRTRHGEEIQESNQEMNQPPNSKGATVRSNLRKRKSDGSQDMRNHYTHNRKLLENGSLLYEIKTVILRIWSMKWRLFVNFSPFVVVAVAFGAFILWNGGIVLGAKEAHVVSPHFAQMMYFSLVAALFTAPMHFSLDQMRNLFQEIQRNWLFSLAFSIVALATGFISVHFFSLAHPYLLADNRHYTFYIWRKIINAHWLIKYLLVPLYVYSWFSILSLLGKTRRKIWVVAYFLATCAVLVPAPLIEFRYYTIPVYLFMLHSNVLNCRTWFITGAIFICINAFTMAMFLFRPFQWSHEHGVQRFIW